MYAKLFASLYNGSLRGRTNEILVFTFLLANADREGYVDVHWRTIGEATGISLEAVKAACAELEAPDTESRSEVEEGRRIVPLDAHRAWGWRIVNYCKYRDIRNADDRRAQSREYKRQARAKNKANADIPNCPPQSATVRHDPPQSAHVDVFLDVDVDADVNSDAKKKKKTVERRASARAHDGEKEKMTDEQALRRKRPCGFDRDKEQWLGMAQDYGLQTVLDAIQAHAPSDRWHNVVEEYLQAQAEAAKPKAKLPANITADAIQDLANKFGEAKVCEVASDLFHDPASNKKKYAMPWNEVMCALFNNPQALELTTQKLNEPEAARAQA